MSGSYLLFLVFGAAALLLWGTRMVRTGVTRAFGSELRRVLSAGLRNRMTAAASGAMAAGSLQSSTAVALLLASFARAGIMPTATGLALMLGADVGSAALASLFTLDIKRFWPVFIFVGYILHTIYDGRSSRGKQSGRICLGVGLILLALDSMGALSADLSTSPTIVMLLEALAGEPLIGVFVIALLTWMAHSSIAMLLFVAALAAAGVLAEPRLVVAMVLGVNLGGAMPAIMLTLAESPEGRRIALGNGLFKLSGAVIGLAALPLLVELYLLLPGDAGFRTVVLHILFNVALATLFLPLIHPVERLLRRLVPASESQDKEDFGPVYISSTPPDVMPSVALASLVRETLRMVDLVDAMLRQSFEAIQSSARGPAKEIAALDDQVDTLYEAIKAYATDLTRQDLDEDESRRAVDIVSYATGLENAGDIIDKSLIDVIEKKIRSATTFSDEGNAEIRRLYDYVLETNRLAAAVTMSWDAGRARELLHRKRAYKGLVADSSQRHLERLRRGESRSVETSSFHLDIIGDLQRVNSLMAGVAYAVANERKQPTDSESGRATAAAPVRS